MFINAAVASRYMILQWVIRTMQYRLVQHLKNYQPVMCARFAKRQKKVLKKLKNLH